MTKKILTEEIKSKALKISAIMDNATKTGDISPLETELVIDHLKSIYDSLLEIPCINPQKISAEGENDGGSVLDSITSGEFTEAAPGETIVRETTTTERVTAYAASIDRDIINSLYGDAADSPAAAEEPSRDAGEVSPEISETEITTTVVTELTQERIVFAGVPEDIPSVASVLSSQSVKSLRNSVGINDKFLLMRDLFSNDMETYDKSMEKLDGFEDIDDAFIYLQENFTMDPDNEGVKLIVSLLERKHA